MIRPFDEVYSHRNHTRVLSFAGGLLRRIQRAGFHHWKLIAAKCNPFVQLPFFSLTLKSFESYTHCVLVKQYYPQQIHKSSERKKTKLMMNRWHAMWSLSVSAMLTGGYHQEDSPTQPATLLSRLSAEAVLKLLKRSLREDPWRSL